MKKEFLFLFVCVFIFCTCKKENKGIRFKIKYESDFIIESGGFLDLPFDVFTPDITTNSEQQFEANDTRKDKIEEIKLESLKLSLTAPTGGNFDFLKSIELYIKADGLDEVKYAFLNQVPDGQTILTMNTIDINLAEYIKKDKFSLRAKTVQDKILSQDAEIKANIVFDVRARLLR